MWHEIRFISSFLFAVMSLMYAERVSAEVPSALTIDANAIRGAGKTGAYYIAGDMLFTEASLRGGITGNKWANAQVNYYFANEVDAAKRAIFRQGASLWSTSSGLEFVENSSAPNRIRVQIPKTGVFCNSEVGMQGGEQILNLGHDLSSTCWTAGIVAHELGHAIGLFHEQNRSDRTPYVEITNVMGTGSPSCDALFTVNWGIRPLQSFSNYDFGSIMHYQSTSTLTSAQCPSGVSATIKALTAQPPGAPAGSEGVCNSPSTCMSSMGNRTTLSLRDKYSIAQRYGHRIIINRAGQVPVSITTSGQIENCGTDCILVSPESSVDIVAIPSEPAIVSFVGACTGKTCQFQPNSNTYVTVRAYRAAALMAIIAAMPSTNSERLFSSGFE